MKAQLSTHNIKSQETRFDYVIASLAPDVAHEVRDLLLKPPSNNPYDALKEALVQRTTLSERRSLQQLFNSEELGDRKPTQLLRWIQQPLVDKVASLDSSFMQELFRQRLPSHVRMDLAAWDTTDLDKLAHFADKIVEVAAPQINYAASSNQKIQQLRSEISELKHIVQSIHQPWFRHRSSSRPSSNSRPPSPAAPGSVYNSPDSFCWYHQRFGEAARKCQSPCSKATENGQASH